MPELLLQPTVARPTCDQRTVCAHRLQTSMDPQDVLDDIARIAVIDYPTLSAIVSAYAVEKQREGCTFEASHALACELREELGSSSNSATLSGTRRKRDRDGRQRDDGEPGTLRPTEEEGMASPMCHGRRSVRRPRPM